MEPPWDERNHFTVLNRTAGDRSLKCCEKNTETRRLTDESVCPTLVHKALRALCGRRFRPTPLTLANMRECCSIGGADPLVCAGPPGPALRSKNQVLATRDKPARGPAADAGVHPTIN